MNINKRRWNKSGYHYYYDLHTVDKRIIRIAGDGDCVKINNTYYDVSIPISLDSLTNWFNPLSVKDAYSISFKGENEDWAAEYKVDAIVTSTTVPFLVFACKTDKLGGGVKFIFANTVLLGFKESYSGMPAGLSALILVFYVKKAMCCIGSKRIAFVPFLSLGLL
ncbi:MAG: hypothetical protein WCD89_19495 [Anaerocolumna sp.]